MLNKIFLIPYFKSNIFNTDFKNKVKNIENNNNNTNSNIVYVFGKIPIKIMNFIKDENIEKELYFITLDNKIILTNKDTNFKDIICSKNKEHIFVNFNEKQKFTDSCILNKYSSICIIKGQILFFEKELNRNISSNNLTSNDIAERTPAENSIESTTAENSIEITTAENDIAENSSIVSDDNTNTDKELTNSLSTIINQDEFINSDNEKTSKIGGFIMSNESNLNSESSLFSEISNSELNDIFKSELEINSDDIFTDKESSMLSSINLENEMNDLNEHEISQKLNSNLFLSDLNFDSDFEKKKFEDFSEIFS